MPLYEGAASNGRVSPVSVRKEWLSSMKWIHCADLHLGSRVETNLTAEKARERKAQLLQTFGRMIDFAAENEVRAVLNMAPVDGGDRLLRRKDTGFMEGGEEE